MKSTAWKCGSEMQRRTGQLNSLITMKIQIYNTSCGKVRCYVPQVKAWITASDQEKLKKVVLKIIEKS